MTNFLRNFTDGLASDPTTFNILRRIVELNYFPQKKLIRRYFGDLSGHKFIDIGSGTGEFAGSFDHLDYHGVDISSDYIAHAKKTGAGKFYVMDATNLEFPNDEFHSGLIMALLHHLDDETAKKVLFEAKRVLKPEGKILIMEDAKIKSLLNFITRPMQALDRGDYIRPTRAYHDLISKHFSIEEHGEFRSGMITYAYFVVRK